MYSTELDPALVLAVVGLVLAGLVISNLPLPWRPVGVRSTPGSTTIRAHSWIIAPLVLLAAAWWAGARHVPDNSGITVMIVAITAVLAIAAWLAWRNGQAELSPDRIVARASFDGRRIAHAQYTAPGQPAHIGVWHTGAPFRPSGLFLNGQPSGKTRRTSGRELVAFAGLVRGTTWTYRALVEVARAGNWPTNTQLVVTIPPSRTHRRLIAEIQQYGVNVDDRTVGDEPGGR